MSGKTGFEIFPDYRKIPVLSAFAPLNIEGLNWAILAEIDESEALQPVSQLIDKVVFYTAIIAVGLVILAVIAGMWFAASVARPVSHLSSAILKVEQNSDFTGVVEIDSSDEIGLAATSFNAMLRTFQKRPQWRERGQANQWG